MDANVNLNWPYCGDYIPAVVQKQQKRSSVKKSLSSRIAAAEAKANLLRMIASVSEAGEYVITKRGKPVAKLIPFEGPAPPNIYGCMKGTFEITGDIMSPLPPEEWGNFY